MSMTITINEAVISKTEAFYPKICNTKDGKQYLIFNISKKFSQRDENTETGWGKPQYMNFTCYIWEGYLIEKFMQHFENGMDLITIPNINLSSFDINTVMKQGKVKDYPENCYSNFKLNGIKTFTMSKMPPITNQIPDTNKQILDEEIPF